MIPALWLLASCGFMPPLQKPQEEVLAGSVTLSVDVTARRARLRIRTIEPAPGPLPAERHGLTLDHCATLKPLVPLEGQQLRPAQVRAWCQDEELSLTGNQDGLAEHLFSGTPPPGTVCEIEVDGQSFSIPPLSTAPVIQVVGTRLHWEPGEGDELRFVIPRKDGESTLCRLRDDGEAPAPAGARKQSFFASRVRLALPMLQGEGRLPVSVIAGTWGAASD